MSNTIDYIIVPFPISCLLAWAIVKMVRESYAGKLLGRSIGWPEAQGKVISNVKVLSHVEVEYEYSVSKERHTGIYTVPLYQQSRFNSSEDSANEVAETLASFPLGSNVLVRFNQMRPGESILYCRGEISKQITES